MSHATYTDVEDLEKNPIANGSHDNIHHSSNGHRLERIGTSIVLTPEMFEKLYFQPHNKVSGDLRSTFGNPTPLYVHTDEPARRVYVFTAAIS